MGYVYLVEFIGSDAFKIGMTNDDDPFKRINSFKTVAPYGIEVKVLIECDDPRTIEKELHSKYKNKRISKSNEFFELNKHDLMSIKSQYVKNDDSDLFLLKEVLNQFDSHYDFKMCMKRILRNFNTKSNDQKDKDAKTIREFLIIEGYEGEFLTSTEIYDIVKDRIVLSKEYTPPSLGIILKLIFERKAKRKNGQSVKGYVIK